MVFKHKLLKNAEQVVCTIICPKCKQLDRYYKLWWLVHQRKYIFYDIEPINSLVNTDILLLSKFEKEFDGINFNKEEPSFSKKKGPGWY